DRVTTGRSRPGKVSYALACFIFRFLRCPLLIRLQTSVFSSHRGAYRRIARDQVSPFFDDWPAVEEKLKVMLSGNELTPEQEALKTALENDD
ncbi:hypothetical protein, partial [Salmonella sp. LSP 578/01]